MLFTQAMLLATDVFVASTDLVITENRSYLEQTLGAEFVANWDIVVGVYGLGRLSGFAYSKSISIYNTIKNAKLNGKWVELMQNGSVSQKTKNALNKLEDILRKVIEKERQSDFFRVLVDNLFKNVDLNNIRKGLIDNPITRKLSQYLTVEEEAIIRYYTTSDGYKDFNKALRGELPITKFFEDYKLFLNNTLDKLPNYVNSGFLYRMETLTEEQLNSIYKVGDVFTNKGFFSTTYSLEVAGRFALKGRNTLIRIKAINGKLIEAGSSLPAENEVLFKTNTRFIVDKIDFTAHPDQELFFREYIKTIWLIEK